MKHVKLEHFEVPGRIATPRETSGPFARLAKLPGRTVEAISLLVQAVTDSIRRAGDTSLESYWSHIRSLQECCCGE